MNPFFASITGLLHSHFQRFLKAVIMGLIAFLPFSAKATHISGADLTYRWISGNTYELSLTLYRDCSGIAAPNNVTITYSSVSCGVNSTVTINRVPGTGNEISMTCSTAVTNCQGGSYPGFQQYEFRGNVTLPNRCIDWVFGYSICCRNCAITTLQYSPTNCTGVPATYIEATLNNLVVPNNSAPIFTNIPVLFFCVGQTFHFNHGAYDSDGDSLAYSWITPRSAAGTNVTFKPGYSASSPLSSSPAITLDNSGDIIITPTALEVGVMAILVREYRNGVLIGSVVRDMEVWTQNCSNIIPTASGVNGGSNFDIVACPGKPLSFVINSNDPNSGQAVSMSYIGNISGATFSSVGSPFPSGTFTWTPTMGQARSQPYSFLITVQDNNCPMNGYQTYSYTILVPPLSASTTGINATCAVPANGSASVTATGSSPFTYSWSPGGSTSSTLNGLSAGNYSVTVTDRYGCTTTATSTINQPPPILVSLTNTPSTCGNANGTAAATVNGGTPPYSFSWSPDTSHVSQRTGLVAGTYIVNVIDAYGCTMTGSTTVASNPSPVVSIPSVSSVSCYGGANGTAIATVSGGASPFVYSWSPSGGNSVSASSLSAGSYSVLVTDANGCTSTAAAIVTQPNPIVLTPTVQNGTCGINNGSAQISGTGGTPPYSYLWQPNSSTTSSITGLAIGNYSVRVTDANGCTASNSMSVGNSGIMSAMAASTTNVSCNGGHNATATVNFSGGTPPFTYQWTPGGYNTASVSGLQAGTYSCVVTDANHCTQSTSATITQPAQMLASTASSVNVNCVGQSDGVATVTVTGGTTPYSYQWQGLSGTSSSVSGLPAGVYTVVVTDVNGCQTSTQANLSEPAPLSAVSTTTSATCGSSNGSAHITVSGGVGPYQYSWSNGSTTTSASGLAAGSYSVTVTDAHHCVSTFSVGISNINGPQASLNFVNPVRCYGEANGSAAINVTGGTPPFVYQWSTGSSTSASAYNLPAGMHTVTVTDANHCVTSIPVQVLQPTALGITVSTTDVTCFNGSNGSVRVVVSGGTSPYSYQWSNSSTLPSLTSLGSGTYTAIVTDANGCTINSTSQINQPTVIGIQPSTHPVNCFGGNDGYASVSVAGGSQPYTYLWNTGATVSMATGLSSGSYSVTVTDVSGCTMAALISITQPSALSLSSSIVNGTCGAANGSATVFAAGGTSPYSYYWLTNGGSASSQSGLAAGSYTVRITDANGCSSTTAINVGNSGMMTASVSSLTPVSCHSGNNASATVALSGGAAPFTYAWTPGGYSTSSVNGLSAGNYVCTVTDANSCMQTVSVSVSEPLEVVASVAVASPISCFGGNNGVVNVNVTGGVAPYSYSWNGNSGTSPSLAMLTVGQYSVTVADANGCTASASAQVTEPNEIALTTASTPAQCGAADGSVSVSTSGGTSPYTYNWSPVNGSSPQLTGISAGSYTVIVTDANQCTHSASAGVSNLFGPQAAISVTSNVSCNGGADGSAEVLVLSGNAPYTFSWSSGSVSGAIASGLSAGQHTATVTDVNGCVATVDVVIVQPDRLLSTVSSLPADCFGEPNGSATVLVSGGVGPYDCIWSNGDHLSTANNLLAGDYTAVITDANGCTVSSFVNVAQPSALAAAVTAFPTTCFGSNDGFATLQCNGGTASYSFLWSNGATSQTITDLQAGSYDVIVTDGNGCSLTSHAVVNEPSQIQITSLSNSVSCFGASNGSILLNVIGGTEPYQYNWLPYGGNDAAAMNLPAGNYSAVITDSHGCTSVAVSDVAEPSAMQTLLTPTPLTCYGSSDGSLRASVNGGVPPYVYSWSGQYAESNSLFNLSAGEYTVIVSDQNGCTSTSSFVFQQPTPVVVNASTTDVICIGQSATLVASASGGTPSYNFSWSTGAVGASAQVSPNATTSYSVTATDANGCLSVPQIVTVNVNPPLVIPFVSGDTICVGDQGVLNAGAGGGNGGPYNYQWSEGSSSNTILVSPSTNTQYTVTVSDNCGTPPVSQIVSMIVNPKPDPGFSPAPPQGCSGLEVHFYSVPNTISVQSSTWEFGDGGTGTGTSTIHTYDAAGSYLVHHIVISDNGCRADAVVPASVIVNPNPVADFSVSNNEVSIFNPTVDFTNLSQLSVAGIWNFGDQQTSTELNPQHTFPDTGVYQITLIVRTEKMCYDTIRKTIHIHDEFAIYFPNTFTPNDDGVNEMFRPFGVGVGAFEMTVLDRWGVEIFTTDNIEKGWDGKFRGNGRECQSDTYVYLAHAVDSSGRKHEYVGKINLVR